MLYTVVFSLMSIALVTFGILLVGAGVRVWMGSDDAYEMNRAVSKGVANSAFGDINQPSGDLSAVFIRGMAYSEGKSGQVAFKKHAKVSRDALRDASI